MVSFVSAFIAKEVLTSASLTTGRGISDVCLPSNRAIFVPMTVVEEPSHVSLTSAAGSAIEKKSAPLSSHGGRHDGADVADSEIHDISSRSELKSDPENLSLSAEADRAEENDGHHDIPPQNMIDPMHFCFIVHGHRGQPTDLSYLHNSVKARALSHNAKSISARYPSAEPKKTRRKKRDHVPTNQLQNQGDDTHHAPKHGNQNEPDRSKQEGDVLTRKRGSVFVVHNAVCNEGRTSDGVVSGGERLTNEILDVIQLEVANLRQEQMGDNLWPKDGIIDVTVSFVGNSLGGLYSRYAVARLSEVLDRSLDNAESGDVQGDNTLAEGGKFYMDENIRVHFNIFCTTASPHLGCASHTYISIPRSAEIGLAHAMGQTGRDLFRVNDLMYAMATSPRFLKPLSYFRKRIAYANAYGTDFPVPGSTAAFLDHNNNYPHCFDEYFDKHGNVERLANEIDPALVQDEPCPATESGLLVAILHTTRAPFNEISKKKDGEANDLSIMSASLDSLGWTKVFIDMRKEIPLGVSLPRLIPTRRQTDDAILDVDPIRKLKPKRVVESRDLAKAVSMSNGKRISLPLGHNAICAFSRGTMSTQLNNGGRSVMDSLAINLTREISSWNCPN